MPATKHCPNCQAEVSIFAPSCPACKASMSGAAPLSRTPRPQSVGPSAAYGSPVTMTPSERRSKAVTQISLQAGIIAFYSLGYAVLALIAQGPGASFVVYSVFAGGFAGTAWAGSQCLPVGRILLMAYSAFCLIGFPIGTLQGVFQFIHLNKPEAKLIFSGRDQFSPDESRDIKIFNDANPNLTAWVRIVNFITLLAFFAGILLAVLTRI